MCEATRLFCMQNAKEFFGNLNYIISYLNSEIDTCLSGQLSLERSKNSLELSQSHDYFNLI